MTNWNAYLGGNHANERSIGFTAGSKALSVQNHGGHNHGQTVPLSRSVKPGDRFKFKANLKSATVAVYHNGKSVGVLFQGIPSCIVPAASNNSSSMDITVRFVN